MSYAVAMGRIRTADGTTYDGVNNLGQLMLQIVLMILLPLLPIIIVACVSLNNYFKTKTPEL